MQPEDRLDALLSLHAYGVIQPGEVASAPGLNGRHSGNGDLQPLLDANDRLSDLRAAEPSTDFADHLEALFLATAASMGNGVSTEWPSQPYDAGWLPMREAPPLVSNDEPTLPGMTRGSMDSEATETDATPLRRLPVGSLRQTTWRRLLWSAIAAALLVAIGATTLTAAAAAGPGTPLYGLHRWEQNVQVSMASDPAARTQLHLSYAQDALAALNAAVMRHQTDSTYDDALATFRDEMSAALSNLHAVSAGSGRDTLEARVAQLRAQGNSDLRGALASLPWPKRASTTTVLYNLGNTTFTVTHADLVYSSGGQHLWTITVMGSGFQSGAVLLLNGQPAGTVTSVTPSALVAQVSGDDSDPPPSTIGVGNPDDTASVTSSITNHEAGDDSSGAQQTPGAETTPTNDDHGGSRDSSTPTDK
jgi:hypothetical protein